MEALKVFAAAIGYLKRHVMGVCGQKFGGVRENDIHWVLTIPAIWGDVAKKFMREAAEQVLLNAIEFISHEQNTEVLRRISTLSNASPLVKSVYQNITLVFYSQNICSFEHPNII